MSAKLRLIVGSDDAGFEYKEALKSDLEASDLVESVQDVGVDAASHTPYPSIAIAAALNAVCSSRPMTLSALRGRTY